MTTPLAKPSTIVEPFAINGQKNTIPTTTATAGAASLDQGFPALTMTPVQQGGVPPSGKDFNGIFNWITQHLAWINGGGQYTFDATLAAFIGGYPVGMVLQSDDGLSSFVNVQANNSANFNTDPTQIGVTWMPYGGAAVVSSTLCPVSTTGGTTVLTNKQAAAGTIIVTGALTSNANIIVPNNVKRAWTIINATSGAFAVNFAPSGGTSLTVTQGAKNVLISDGSTMSYGTSDAPTQAASDNSTKIANTAFVATAIANALVNTPLTGNPTAPTQTAGDNSTRLANTAFVVTAIANALFNTTLTGNPTAPTQAANDNSTKIATTAYADRAANNILTNAVTQYKTASFTAAATGDYWVNTLNGAFTMTLPDPPTGANPIKITDVAAALSINPVTINPGTKTILGDSSLVFDVNGESLNLWYDGSTWRLA